MEILGHSQIALTMNTYSHVAPEVSREAAERMARVLWQDDDQDQADEDQADEDQADEDQTDETRPTRTKPTTRTLVRRTADERRCCLRCCSAGILAGVGYARRTADLAFRWWGARGSNPEPTD